MSIKYGHRFAINTTTFTAGGETFSLRWTYERDEDDTYPIPVGMIYPPPSPEYYDGVWKAIKAAAAVTPPVRL